MNQEFQIIKDRLVIKIKQATNPEIKKELENKLKQLEEIVKK